MLYSQLGDMKCIDGSSLSFEVNRRSSEYAIHISDALKTTSIFKELFKKLESQRLLLYLQFIIKREIYPFVKDGSVIQWHKDNGKEIYHAKDVVLIPKIGIFYELAKYWDFKDVKIKLINPVSLNSMRDDSCRNYLRKLVRSYVKGMVHRVMELFSGLKRKGSFLQTLKGQNIACHFVEGIDYAKRNDLSWYSGNYIAPEKVLIYFDSLYVKTGKPIKKETIQQIEKFGFRWITLKKGIVENGDINLWYAPQFPKYLHIVNGSVRTPTEKWLVKIGNDLLKQVYFWRSFYDAFNIYINYIPEEGFAKNIAQAIAFDIKKEKAGVLVGRQRSEVYIPLYSSIGFHPKHIFFTWNKRLEYYLGQNYEHIETLVTTGYPYNILQKYKNWAEMLRSKGVKFVIALLDGSYGPDTPCSEKSMAEFYLSMLSWVINDRTVGLVIKSKKAIVIQNLVSIQPLLNEALKTGRCIRIEDEWGRLPSEASFGADIAVGAGISSALMEAVIAGCRGVHYDMGVLKGHEFYKWGYESIIFDNLQRLMAALKRYKENPRSEPKLGDWTSFLDLLDPFHDARGGERMGVYMRWLLESFAAGKNRDQAIQYANGEYAKLWGEDKIINMRYAYETT